MAETAFNSMGMTDDERSTEAQDQKPLALTKVSCVSRLFITYTSCMIPYAHTLGCEECYLHFTD